MAASTFTRAPAGALGRMPNRLRDQFSQGLRAWARSHDFDLLLGSYPYYIPKKLLREKIRAAAANAKGALIDVGCGNQPYRFLFSGVDTYLGMDLDAGRRPDLVGSAEALPLSAGAADTILCTEVLEHCRDPQAVMRELARVLRPGGRLILTTPMSWNMHYEPHDYFRFTRYGLAMLARQAGLNPQTIERIGGVFALTGARLTEVICKSTARALKFLPSPIRLALVHILYVTLTAGFLVASRLLDWVDQSDAIGWLLVGRKDAEAATG